jgi:hypothetical protein
MSTLVRRARTAPRHRLSRIQRATLAYIEQHGNRRADLGGRAAVEYHGLCTKVALALGRAPLRLNHWREGYRDITHSFRSSFSRSVRNLRAASLVSLQRDPRFGVRLLILTTSDSGGIGIGPRPCHRNPRQDFA